MRLRDTPDLWVHRQFHGLLCGAGTIRDLPIELGEHVREVPCERARDSYQEVPGDTGL